MNANKYYSWSHSFGDRRCDVIPLLHNPSLQYICPECNTIVSTIEEAIANQLLPFKIKVEAPYLDGYYWTGEYYVRVARPVEHKRGCRVMWGRKCNCGAL